MLYLFIAIILELSLIYFFSRRAFYGFRRVLLRLFGGFISEYFVYFFYLPGVLVHELTHYFSAKILGVRVSRLRIFPIGYVEIEKAGLLRTSLVALSPFLIGVGLFFLTTYLFMVESVFESFWGRVFFVYIIFVISNTMFLSKSDIKNSWVLVVFVVAASFIILKIYGFEGGLIYSGFVIAFKYLLIVVIVNLALLFLLSCDILLTWLQRSPKQAKLRKK